jgi:hypothetical protein
MLAYGEEGASNPAQDLYVVNNTFLNDYTGGGTFVLVGTGVTRGALLQNNIFGGVGTVTNQASAVQKTNYRAITPAFVDRAHYDLRPAPNVAIVNAASAPGYSATGMSLKPGAVYKHVASGASRPVVGALDIGAYEATSP